MRLIAHSCAVVLAAALESIPSIVSAAEVTTLSNAVSRDLGLSPAQAAVRQDRELRSELLENALRATLSGSFGGAWYDDGALKIGVLDRAGAAVVRTAGATRLPVLRSEQLRVRRRNALVS